MMRNQSQARPKSQPPIKLSEMVASGLANKKHRQKQLDETLSKLRSEEEEHWTKRMDKYEKSRSLRFSAARMSSRNLKTLSENQTEDDCHTNATSGSFARLNMLELVPGEAGDISPLTSSSGSSSSSSGGSSLASSTLSLSSVSSASTVMAVESTQKRLKSSSHTEAQHEPEPFGPLESRKDSLGSDEESSSNSSSCSSSSGISSICQATNVAVSQVLDSSLNNGDSLIADRQLERAVAESLEALVSSVAASQTDRLAPLAFDVLMVKVVAVGEEETGSLNTGTNLINQHRSIINKCRRHIFNALTHAQKVGRREAGWRVELQLSDELTTARIRWFKEAHETDDDEESETETIILADRVIDCLVEHELVIWLVASADSERRASGNSCGPTGSPSLERINSGRGNQASGRHPVARQFQDAKLAVCGGPSRANGSESNSPVCGNLIGITCELDQMSQAAELQHVESIIWLCSNELDAEQVQESWREFRKRRPAMAREQLVSIRDVEQMEAIKSRDFLESISALANDDDSQESMAAATTGADGRASVEDCQVVGHSQLSGGDGHLSDDDKIEHCDDDHHQNGDEDGGNQINRVVGDVTEADEELADAGGRREVEEQTASREMPRASTGLFARARPMDNNGQEVAVAAAATAASVSTRLRRTVSVFSLTLRNDRSAPGIEHPKPGTLGSGANSASSQFLTTCGADLTTEQEDEAAGRRSVSSKIIKSLGQIQCQSRLASPANQIELQQRQRSTCLKVGSTCDLSSSSQQLDGGRRLVPASVTTAKRLDDHPQQARASAASADNVSSVSAAPVVKPRTSILKRQIAAGSCLLSPASTTKGQQQQSGAKAAPSQAAGGKSALGSQDNERVNLKPNIDRIRTGNSSRQQLSSDRSGKELVVAASIDKLSDPLGCGRQSTCGDTTRRRAMASSDNCAQVISVSSSTAAAVRMVSKSGAPFDEQTAPRETRPGGDLRIKLDHQSRRLATGATKISPPNHRHQSQQQSGQSRGQPAEACKESQSSERVAMATSASRSERAPAKTTGNDAGSRRQRAHEASPAINQTTKTRRKAVHSLANCELLARHHQSQQQQPMSSSSGDVTIKVTAARSRESDEAEGGDEKSAGGSRGNLDDVEFVATGSVAREQAFERLRQRASCYDISRLMSKNSVIQNQLARLRATGPSRGHEALTSNELRQRKPAELLQPGPDEGSSLEERRAGNHIKQGDENVGERRSEVEIRAKNKTKDKRESNQILDTTDDHLDAAQQQPKARASIEGNVPASGIAVLRQGQAKVADVVAECGQDESDEAGDDDGQSDKGADSVDGDGNDKEEVQEGDQGGDNKKTNPSRAAATTGLSKFNLLRQSFNQKTISSMLKFSSRASLRIRPSKPVAQDSVITGAATQEVQQAAAPVKQLAVGPSTKTGETVDQQQQKQIAALDSATLMLYNRHIQQRQQQKIIQQQQQQQQQQYALQWQQHQFYIQQQQHQQQRRQQLAFIANQYVASQQHQLLSGIQLAPSLATIGSFSTAASSMYAQQLMMMQQQQHQLQPVQSVPKASSSNVVGSILRKSILKSSSSKAKQELAAAAASRQVVLGATQTAAHHYAHAPSHLQQSHVPMIPFEVNHHSSVNIVYGADSRATLAPNYGLSSGASPSHLNDHLDQLRQQQQRGVGSTTEVKADTPSQGASSLKASMRKKVKSILINRTSGDHGDSKTQGESQMRIGQSQQQRPLKSALKSTLRRNESTLNLNSDGSDGDQSNSSSLESSSSSDRFNEAPAKQQLKSALKKPPRGGSGSSITDESHLVAIMTNVDNSSAGSNLVDNSFKRAISARCSRRLTVKSVPKESPSETSIPPKTAKKNVTFSSKLTSIQ